MPVFDYRRNHDSDISPSDSYLGGSAQRFAVFSVYLHASMIMLSSSRKPSGSLCTFSRPVRAGCSLSPSFATSTMRMTVCLNNEALPQGSERLSRSAPAHDRERFFIR
jgi:hypothetical protein